MRHMVASRGVWTNLGLWQGACEDYLKLWILGLRACILAFLSHEASWLSVCYGGVSCCVKGRAYSYRLLHFLLKQIRVAICVGCVTSHFPLVLP